MRIAFCKMILQREVLQKRIFKHAWTDKNRRNDMGAENTEYGADQIQILEGLEAVRKRPGMYIGST